MVLIIVACSGMVLTLQWWLLFSSQAFALCLTLGGGLGGESILPLKTVNQLDTVRKSYYYYNTPIPLIIINFTVRRAAGNIGIMFLNEVALGKEHHITRDDSSLTTPPKGFDSVIAKGRTEPGKPPIIIIIAL